MEPEEDVLQPSAKRPSTRQSAASIVAQFRNRNRGHRSSTALATSISDHRILGSYRIAGDVGASWTSWTLELFVMLGLVLPWFGPMGGLFVISPIIEMNILESRWITKDTQCFTDPVNVCNSTSQYQYYFWNITNPNEFMAGSAPPALQELGPYTFTAHTVNYNINFTYNYTDVAYNNYSYQDYNASASCEGCSLNDSFIGINRAYQNLLTNTGGSEYPAVLQLSPALLGGVINTLETSFAPYAAYYNTTAVELGLRQWSNCAVVGGSIGGNAMYPYYPELCGYALHVAYPPFTLATLPPEAVSVGILTSMIGSTSALGIDPAALQACNLFAFVPAPTVAAITQLPLAWVELYSGYLYYVAKTFGGAAFQSYVLGGPLLSADAGGFIANKTIHEWLYGWVDPILADGAGGPASPAAKMSLTYAFETRNRPMEIFQKNLTDLSYNTSALFFWRNVSSGRDQGDVPQQIEEYNEQKVLHWPQGSVTVQGADNGLVFDFYLNKTRPEQMFDPSLFRTINISYQGSDPVVKGLHTYQYGVALESNQSCAQQIVQRAALQAASIKRNKTAPPLDLGMSVDRCAYPDAYSGTWNMSETYLAPTILTRARFFGADPSLANSSGNNFMTSLDQHGWNYAVEHISGLTIDGNRTYQLSHLVKPTDVVYPNVWTQPGAAAQGLWMPSFWTRVSFGITDLDAKNLVQLLKVRQALLAFFVMGLPLIGAIVFVPATVIIHCNPWAWERKRTLALLAKSRARPFELPTAHIDLGARRSSLALAEPADNSQQAKA